MGLLWHFSQYLAGSIYENISELELCDQVEVCLFFDIEIISEVSMDAVRIGTKR